MEDLDYLIDYLIKENPNINIKEIKGIAKSKEELLRGLMNVVEPKEISTEFIKVQDRYLQDKLKAEKIVNVDELNSTKNIASKSIKNSDKIFLWKGDITKIKADCIVNAANKYMLGCRIPLHYCIDNAIHSFAGLQLRNDCYELMKKQGYNEPTGTAKITKGYNLPSKFVIHTVGPIIYDKVKNEDIEALKSSYYECMKLAEKNNIRSLVFCSISTGEFSFPKEMAAKIAVEIVDEFLTKSNVLKKVVFNVFSDIDYEIYKNTIKVGVNEKK